MTEVGSQRSEVRKSATLNTLLFALSLVGPALFALCSAAEAQQVTKVNRIGYLGSGSFSSMKARIEAFRQVLREHNYVEGKTIIIEYRYADGKPDRLPDLAAELVRLNVDVIVVEGGTSGRAAKNATQVIPIVMANVSDAVGIGLVASLARPGGNVTGLTTLNPELGGKRLELLKEIVPRLSRVAVVGNPDTQSYIAQMNEIELGARALGLMHQPIQVRGVDDVENAFATMTKERVGAVIVLAGPGFSTLRRRIAELAIKSRLPAVYQDKEFVDVGGLISYGADFPDLYRRAALYVDRILKGAKPADLPVEQPTKFELAINLKTAKQIGLTIPPGVLVRADKVVK